MNSRRKAIEVKGVWFSYDHVPVLEDITFDVDEGDFCVIIGPNGGGKTTLLRLLLGILKPNRGEIRVLGENPHSAKHRIGYLPQYINFNLSFPVSVMDVALMGRLNRSSFGKGFTEEDRKKVEQILLLDEPTAGVDPEYETGIYEILKELNKDMTIVVVTHDIGVVSRYARSIACVNRRLVFHEEGQITKEMLEMAYECPVDLIAHGLPHRVLPKHK